MQCTSHSSADVYPSINLAVQGSCAEPYNMVSNLPGPLFACKKWARACVLQVDGCIEWSTSYFWKQKYCRSHSSDGTPHCCSCNKLRPVGTKWLTLSDKRMVCHDCSTTVVHDSAQAQPLLDEVILCLLLQCLSLHPPACVKSTCTFVVLLVIVRSEHAASCGSSVLLLNSLGECPICVIAHADVM